MNQLRRSVLFFCSLLWAVFLILPGHAQAQDAATVRGVVEDSTGTPLPGANVRVQGTQQGVSTDGSGTYELSSVSPGERTIVASFVGYEQTSRTVTLEPGETRTIDFTLRSGTVGMGDVVVTALGVDREERSLGYSVDRVSGQDLEQTTETNVMNSLAGKVSGLNVISGGSGLTSTPRVTVRGETSLTGSGRPLIVVNGIPIDNTPSAEFSDAQTTQVDFGNGLSQINSQDIAEMSVLKGPSAAALYGSRAADGVILIETKDGSEADGIGATVNTKVTGSTPLRLPDYQNEYSYGNGGEFSFVDGTGAPGWNWGVPLDEGIVRNQWRIGEQEMTSAAGNVRDFFEPGVNVTTDVAVRGGNENGNFRASVSRSDQTGIVPNTDLDRTNVTMAAGYDVTEDLRVDANANYAKSTSDNLPTSGYGSESIMYYFTWGARDIPMDRLKDHWVDGQEGIQQAHYDLNWTNNPFFQVHENTNSLNRNRLYGGVTARYDFTDNLDLRARTGLDYNEEDTKQRKAFSSITAPNGWLRERDQNFLEWNSNLLLNYSREVGDFTIEPTVGANFMRQTRRSVQLTAQALSVPEVYNIGNSRSNVQAEEIDQEEEILGVFGSSTIGYQEMVFLDLTARNDWSSTLPTDNNSYFYPSASLSVIASELFEIPDPVSFAKVRASWAQVGNDTEPFRLRNTYTFEPAWGGTQTVVAEPDLANPELEPEITSSVEVGTNVRLFSDRVELDATYYNSSTENQILRVPLARSTGFNTRLVNAGEVRNEGVEARVRVTAIEDLSGFGWDVSLNWYRNRSTIEELAPGIDVFELGEGPFGGSVQAREGGRLGDIYGRVFERVEDESSPHHGEIIYEGGLPQLTDEVQKVGNYNHDWQGGIGTTLRYENLQLDVLVDLRKGGIIYSNTHATGIEGGTLEGTTCCRNQNVVGDGVVQNEDGSFSENETSAPYVTWLRTYYDRPNVESNSFDATYAKLREVTLQYNFTPSWLTSRGVQNVGLSLVGRNLLLWTHEVPHIDPETTMSTGRQQTPGFEVQQLPSTRSFGMNLRLDF